jgi:hypothetical protein
MRATTTLSRASAVALVLLMLVLPGCWKVDADLEVSDNEIDFGAGRVNTEITVTNDSKDKAITSGVEALDYRFESDRSWVTIAPVSGRLEGEQTATHMIAVDRSGLAFGSHVATITVTSNGGNATIIVRVTRSDDACEGAPDAPSGPSPGNGDTGVSVASSLDWERGESQCDDLDATYDVYFGTSSPPPFHHNNGGSKSWDPGGLASNTLYYWRVVAKDANGSTSSATWSFRTAGVVACDDEPSNIADMTPSDGADDVSLDANLSWSGGNSRCPGLTATYDVYFGTDSTPPLRQNTGSTKTWDPGTLEANRTYYWRIVAKDANGSTSSAVRDFRTRDDDDDCDESITPPCNPSPKDRADRVNRNANLSWRCGSSFDEEDDCDSGVTYVVYLGTGESLGEGDILGTTGSRSYNLPELASRQKYYWKIVARLGSQTKTSETWEFETR